MKKLGVAIISLIFIIILSFTSFLLLLDYNSISENLLKNLNMEISSSNISQIKIHKFPFPYIKIGKLDESNKAKIENLTIKLSIFSLLTFSPKINEIKAENITIYLSDTHGAEFNLTEHDRIIVSILKKGFVYKNINISNLNFLDQGGKNLLAITDFKFTDAKEFSGKYNNIGFTGTITFKEKIEDFEVAINSDSLQLNELYENYVLKRGAVQIQIKDFQYFLNYFIPNVSNIFSNITSKETININLDIFKEANSLNFKNIKITSPTNNINGEGEVVLYSNDNLTDTIKFNFSNMNLITDINAQSTILGDMAYGSRKFVLTNKNANIEIDINKLLFNDQKLNNIKFDAQFNKNILNISDFSGKIGDNGNFKIEGNISNNDYRNIFDGKIKVSHEDFNDILTILGYQDDIKVDHKTPFILESSLKFSSIDLYIRDILFKTLETQITGKIAIKFIGSMPRINSVLEIEEFNADKMQYPLITPAINYVKGLFENMKNEDYLNKYIPVRAISYLGNFDFTLNNFSVLNYDFNKVHLLIGVFPSKITVDSLYLTTKNNDYISAKIDLDTHDIKPTVKLTIYDAFIPVNFLRPSSLEQTRNSLLQNYDFDKLTVKFGGNISTLYQDDLELKNIAFQIQNDSNLFKVSNLETEIFGGKLTANGSVLLDPYTFNFVYALNSINIEQLSNIIPKSLLTNTQGVFSSNGMITTNGESIEKLLYNLYFKSRLVTRGIKFNNFSIDDLVMQINTPTYNGTSFTVDLKKAMLTGETVFQELEGDVELNKGYLILKDMKFKTEYTAGVFASTLNIYDFKLNLSSIFSFFYNKPGAIRRTTVRLPIKADGSYFQPNKVPDPTEMEEALNNNSSQGLK